MSKYTENLVTTLQAQDVWTYAEAVAFAEEHNLKPRSVIAKINSLGLQYVPKPKRVNKRQEPVVKKEAMVNAIQAALGVTVPSLMKATKADLERLVPAVGAEMPEAE